jgi:lipid-A-disaccharide synthase
VAGALVATAVRRRHPRATLFGIGGHRLASVGVEILHETNHLGCVGLTETFSVLPALARAFRTVSREVRRRRPQAALLIGNDLFNCLLARFLRRAGVRTVCFFPPQVWLWRSLARPIGASYDAVLTSFPEEQETYARGGAAAQFVGHYLCERLRPVDAAAREAARARLGLPPVGPVVALLPGSRRAEVRELGPILIDAAARLWASDQGLRFALPVADPRYAPELLARVAESPIAGRVATGGDGQTALAASDLALMASGTASLEAALLGVPMVLLYRLAPVTVGAVALIRWLGLIEARTVGLPNLLLGEPVVPELREARATAENLAAVAAELLADPARRQAMRARLARIAPLLAGEGTIEAVADCLIAQAEGQAWPRPVARPAAPRLAASGGR